MTSLKASRDKLLSEVDSQSREIERLLTENSVLEQVQSDLNNVLMQHAQPHNLPLSTIHDLPMADVAVSCMGVGKVKHALTAGKGESSVCCQVLLRGLTFFSFSAVQQQAKANSMPRVA